MAVRSQMGWNIRVATTGAAAVVLAACVLLVGLARPLPVYGADQPRSPWWLSPAVQQELGLTKVQVFQFPNHLCTDHGRAIDQREPGWENTLTGIPKEILEFWKRRLQPHGYRLSYEIVDFSSGVRGDVGVILSWD